MKDVLQHIGGRFKRDRQELPDEVIAGFLRVLEEVRIEDMSCDQVYTRLDEYVEREMHGENVAQLMPLLREHFDLCTECCEEYEALLAWMARTETDSD